MWCTIHAFCKSKASTPYQKLELPESRVRSAISALNHGCIIPIPSLQLQKKICHMQRSRGSGWVAIQWLCCLLCYVTASNQRTIVEIETLVTLSWTCGCQPFSCRCSQNVMHNPCMQSLHSLPEAWASWEPRTFRHLCIKSWLHHAHPFVAAAEKTCHMQRSRGSGWVAIQWLCCQLCYVTASNQRTIVEIETLVTVSWTCGCQPFSCRCSQNVRHCRMEMCWTCLFQESIPTRCFLRAAACYTSSAFLYNSQIHCSWRKRPVSCREAEGLVTELWSPRIVAISWLCFHVTTVNWAFSLRGLEAGRPAFQLRMFAKCDTVPNEIWGTCLFQESIPSILVWNSKHPLPTRTRSWSFLRAERSIGPALWLHHAHAFLAAAGENQSHAEKQRVWLRRCGLQDLLQYTVYWLCSCMTAAN